MPSGEMLRRAETRRAEPGKHAFGRIAAESMFGTGGQSDKKVPNLVQALSFL